MTEKDVLKKCQNCGYEIFVQPDKSKCSKCQGELSPYTPKKGFLEKNFKSLFMSFMMLMFGGYIFYLIALKPSFYGKTANNSASKQVINSADENAKHELQKTDWVRDVFVSPAHMNIGVIRGEKQWDSPAIGKWACGIITKHGSRLTWIRFVDINDVVNKGKSPNQAEISKFQCQ